jgi:hypothetical protein
MRKYASSTVSVRSLSICIVVLLAASVFAAAQHGKYIHSFEGLGDGADPVGTLIADPLVTFTERPLSAATANLLVAQFLS